MEKEKIFLIGVTVMFTLALVLVSKFVFFNNSTPSGYATLDDEQKIQEDIQKLLRTDIFSNLGSKSKLCIIIPNGETSLSYNIDKINNLFMVTLADQESCNGQFEEDFILRFNDYESFKNNKKSISCRFKEEKDKGYSLLPSKFLSGSEAITCNDEFKDKYCALVNECMTDYEISAASIVGCCDSITRPVIESAVEIDEKGLIPFIPVSLMIFIGIPLLLMSITASAFILLKSNSPPKDQDDELEKYIRHCLGRGFHDFQIRNVLLQEGWKHEHIDKTFHKVNGNADLDPMKRFFD